LEQAYLENYNQMKHSIKGLVGYTMHATDGEIGQVEEFYFDDQAWKIRYLIVKTGGWLSGRKVLISTQALLTPDWANRQFPVNLSKEQVRQSPDIDTNMPVSHREEAQLLAHYPWQGYVGSGYYSGGSWGVMPSVPVLEEVTAGAVKEQLPGDTHLRSTKRVTGYSIHALDGEIGAVTDFIVDDTNWGLGFLVVETGGWLHARLVVFSVKWIREVRWADSTIIVEITKDRVRTSPAYDEPLFVDNTYEQLIFENYCKQDKK
jgi:uncharacterized protein YrrD